MRAGLQFALEECPRFGLFIGCNGVLKVIDHGIRTQTTGPLDLFQAIGWHKQKTAKFVHGSLAFPLVLSCLAYGITPRAPARSNAASFQRSRTRDDAFQPATDRRICSQWLSGSTRSAR